MNRPLLRVAVLLLFAIAASACEGLLAPTSGPSSFTPPPYATTPSPTPAPAPPVAGSEYASVLGTWVGTTTITAGLIGLQGSNTCNETWTITAQNGGRFSGTFQASGGITVDCAQSGTVSASFTPNGTLSDLVHSAQIAANAGCTRLSATPYSGSINPEGTSLMATSTERLTCGSGSSVTLATRTIVVSMTKR